MNSYETQARLQGDPHRALEFAATSLTGSWFLMLFINKWEFGLGRNGAEQFGLGRTWPERRPLVPENKRQVFISVVRSTARLTPGRPIVSDSFGSQEHSRRANFRPQSRSIL